MIDSGYYLATRLGFFRERGSGDADRIQFRRQDDRPARYATATSGAGPVAQPRSTMLVARGINLKIVAIQAR